MQKLLDYLRDTRGELKHVSWPTQRQTMMYTTIVAALSILTAAYLGALDYLYKEGLALIIPS